VPWRKAGLTATVHCWPRRPVKSFLELAEETYRDTQRRKRRAAERAAREAAAANAPSLDREAPTRGTTPPSPSANAPPPGANSTTVGAHAPPGTRPPTAGANGPALAATGPSLAASPPSVGANAPPGANGPFLGASALPTATNPPVLPAVAALVASVAGKPPPTRMSGSLALPSGASADGMEELAHALANCRLDWLAERCDIARRLAPTAVVPTWNTYAAPSALITAHPVTGVASRLNIYRFVASCSPFLPRESKSKWLIRRLGREHTAVLMQSCIRHPGDWESLVRGVIPPGLELWDRHSGKNPPSWFGAPASTWGWSSTA